MRTWQRRRPEESALYRAVQAAWATVRARLAQAERPLPRVCVREVAAITAPESIERVLRAMGLSAEAPELAPAGSPPGGDYEWPWV